MLLPPNAFLHLEQRLHPRQWEVFNCPARFRVLVAGRRFGKTELAVAELLLAATQRPNQVVWYIGPTDKQARRVIWRRVKRLARPYQLHPPGEKDSLIELTNGSTITISGSFNPDGLRGDGLNFVVLDEVASMKRETWEKVIRPAMSCREGRALFLGTPKGRDHLYRYFELAKTNADWASFQFTTGEGGLVRPKELDSAAADMDEQDFDQEYEAQFTTVGKHRVYYSFDPAINVRSDIKFDGMIELVWTIDFNVDPMCMLLMQRRGDDIYVLEEIILANANTTMACQQFIDRAKPYNQQVPWTLQPMSVKIYGDVSGNQRHTSGSATDWTIIKEFLSSWKTTVEPRFYHGAQNPAVRDRVNCVNARLCNKHGDARLFIHPSCKELIRDLEEVSWAVDTYGSPTRDLDKRDRFRTHASDALGYYVSQIFPMRGPTNN